MPEWYSYHFKQQKPDLEIFLKIRFLPPCRPYQKFQKSARFGQKNFQAYKVISLTDLQCLSDILIISSNKSQIWKYFWKLDFCPHAGPIENSKNQPDLVKKFFNFFYKVISLTDLQCLSDILIISSNKSQIWKYFWKLDFCPHAGPIENSKNQPDLLKIFFKL